MGGKIEGRRIPIYFGTGQGLLEQPGISGFDEVDQARIFELDPVGTDRGYTIKTPGGGRVEIRPDGLFLPFDKGTIHLFSRSITLFLRGGDLKPVVDGDLPSQFQNKSKG